ncbi:MAG: AAA family ATPase [Nanoarchaeota archaeon]|nr:AAA family ATPase [Nanoarchaeota archaeon]
MEYPKPSLKNFIENYDHSIRNKFLSYFEKGVNKFIFNGPNGSGKTFLARAFANDYDFSFEDINLYLIAETETESVADRINNLIERMSQNGSLFSSQKKVIFVESAEKALRTSPLIFSKLSKVKNAIIIFESESGDIFRSEYRHFVSDYQIINFYRLNSQVIEDFLIKVCETNKIKISRSLLDKIAINSRGSLSSALTDLETYALIGDVEPQKRDQEEDIFSTLNRIFSGEGGFSDIFLSTDQAAKIFEIWISDNLPSVFKGKDLYSAYDLLSYIDILIKRIHAQNWELLKYISALSFGGISSMAHGKVKLTYRAPDWKLYYGLKQ